MSSKYSAKAILVCPYWPFSTFGLFLFKAEGEFQSFVMDIFVIEDVPKYIKLGNYKELLIGSDQFQGRSSEPLTQPGGVLNIWTNKIVFFVFRPNFEGNDNKVQECK